MSGRALFNVFKLFSFLLKCSYEYMKKNKSSGPNSIPTRILKLLKKDISIHLVGIFNLSFSSGIYPTALKTAKVIVIHKKDSKLGCSNCRPIVLQSNIDNFNFFFSKTNLY